MLEEEKKKKACEIHSGLKFQFEKSNFILCEVDEVDTFYV